jgi:hypothetical protein
MRAINENKVAKFLKDGHAAFLKGCADAEFFNKSGKKEKGIPATKRQASKWMMGKGIARKTHEGII